MVILWVQFASSLVSVQSNSLSPSTSPSLSNSLSNSPSNSARLTSLGRSLLRRKCSGNIQFEDHGRPFIANEVDFNISHQNNWVGIGFTAVGRLGIDIADTHAQDLSPFETIFTSQEWAFIGSNCTRFALCWALKESIVKAIGCGIDMDLRWISLTVNLDHDLSKAKISAQISHPSSDGIWSFGLYQLDPYHILAFALMSDQSLTIRPDLVFVPDHELIP